MTKNYKNENLEREGLRGKRNVIDAEIFKILSVRTFSFSSLTEQHLLPRVWGWWGWGGGGDVTAAKDRGNLKRLPSKIVTEFSHFTPFFFFFVQLYLSSVSRVRWRVSYDKLPNRKKKLNFFSSQYFVENFSPVKIWNRHGCDLNFQKWRLLCLQSTSWNFKPSFFDFPFIINNG